MNERIGKILNRSGGEFYEGFAGSPNTIKFTEEELQTFAELIVRECMAMSDELKAQYLTSRKSTMDFDEKNIYAEGEAACDVLKYKMKKHFGVEE
jgi:hypothetical protein